MDLLDLMLDHDHWATGELLKVCATLDEAQLDQPFDIGHRTLRETFGHIVYNIPFWGAFLAGQPTEGEFSADFQPDDRSVPALIEYHERGYKKFADSARKLRDEDRLGETYADHWKVKKSFGGTVVMVIEHNEGHRTEIAHILQRLGVAEIPEVDLGVWEYYLYNR